MANLNIRVDDTLKRQAETILNDIGMSLSTATTIFYKQLVRHNGIPFELKADPFWSQQNQERLRRSMQQMESTGGTVHEITEPDEN